MLVFFYILETSKRRAISGRPPKGYPNQAEEDDECQSINQGLPNTLLFNLRKPPTK